MGFSRARPLSLSKILIGAKIFLGFLLAGYVIIKEEVELRVRRKRKIRGLEKAPPLPCLEEQLLRACKRVTCGCLCVCVCTRPEKTARGRPGKRAFAFDVNAKGGCLRRHRPTGKLIWKTNICVCMYIEGTRVVAAPSRELAGIARYSVTALKAARVPTDGCVCWIFFALEGERKRAIVAGIFGNCWLLRARVR